MRIVLVGQSQERVLLWYVSMPQIRSFPSDSSEAIPTTSTPFSKIVSFNSLVLQLFVSQSLRLVYEVRRVRSISEI